MPRSLLPPRGIEIPTALLYDRNISPAVRDTWAQLRGLAWGQKSTPEVSVKYLSGLFGKSASTIYEHMRLLKSWGALSWRTIGQSNLIAVDFPDSVLNSEKLESDPDTPPDSEFLEKPPLLSPSSINTQSINGGIKEIPNFRKVGMENRRKPDTVPAEILRPIIDALADVTTTDKKLNYSRLAKEAKALHLAGYTADQVVKAYGENGKWYTVDWRGLKGEIPSLGTIRATIKAVLAAKPPNSNGSKPPMPQAPEDPMRAAIRRRLEKTDGK